MLFFIVKITKASSNRPNSFLMLLRGAFFFFYVPFIA